MEGAVIEKDFHEEEYFGNVRLDDTAVLQTSEDVVISMKNLHKTYLLGVEGVPALRGVSLTIKRGEFVCIFGTSGGGKTTMLNIIGTIDKPTKGEMNLCGHMINHKTDDLTLAMIRLKKIGFVFQTFNLLSSLTALENVEMPMILAGELSAEERRTRATSLLTMVGMGGRLDHVPSQLSGGEQQRVTIARAMANKPDILLLDEPTGDLDTANTAIVMKLLTRLNKEDGITLVMVTHDVGLKMFSDRVIWMRDGKIQRIEAISDAARQDAHKKLDEEIDRIEKKRAGLLPRAATATIMRDPQDYKPLSWRKPQNTQPLNHSGNLASSSSQPHISGPNNHTSGPSQAPAEPANDRYTEYLQSHSTVFPDQEQPHQNGKSHAKTGSGGGEDGRLAEIIGGISNGLILQEEELEDEESLTRKKPIVSTPLLVDDEIQTENGAIN
eukprot:Phypoly_transcript_07160.p1 GENE.Phypoly_transcript_07160~~Phypoly_transcript_07160.p1  ORF type:complete len:440 (+),score=74.40 Phypoly_transcript_07160:207-1526(+)